MRAVARVWRRVLRRWPALGNLTRRKPRGPWLTLWGKSAPGWGDGNIRGAAEGVPGA